MKQDLNDPKFVLDALLTGAALPGDLGLEEVSRARAMVLSVSTAEPSAVSLLPKPLALAVLEAAVRARETRIPEALSASPTWEMAKAAKKALYRLRSLGVPVPQKAESAPVAPASAAIDELPCTLSPITASGERALMLPKAMRGGSVQLAQLIVSDERGIVSLARGATSRSAYRRHLKEARSQSGVRAIDVPLAEAREIVAEAAGQNLKAKIPFPEGTDELLRQLEIAPKEELEELPPPTTEDLQQASEAKQLHDEPEIQAWLPPESEMRALVAKMEEVVHSPLQLTETQRSEQLVHVLRTATDQFFTPERRRLYARRLWQMGRFFERTERDRAAATARSEARRLFHSIDPWRSPFADFLFDKVLVLVKQMQAGGHLPEASAASSEGRARDEERRSPGGIILP
jgi:hypothetical protein